jgi:hypothetical protein
MKCRHGKNAYPLVQTGIGWGYGKKTVVHDDLTKCKPERRKLRGVNPLRFLCWLGFHRWTDWKLLEPAAGSDPETIIVVEQARRCRTCDYDEINQIGYFT